MLLWHFVILGGLEYCWKKIYKYLNAIKCRVKWLTCLVNVIALKSIKYDILYVDKLANLWIKKSCKWYFYRYLIALILTKVGLICSALYILIKIPTHNLFNNCSQIRYRSWDIWKRRVIGADPLSIYQVCLTKC